MMYFMYGVWIIFGIICNGIMYFVGIVVVIDGLVLMVGGVLI